MFAFFYRLQNINEKHQNDTIYWYKQTGKFQGPAHEHKSRRKYYILLLDCDGIYYLAFITVL